MVLKLIQATSAKPGTTVLWDGFPCIVKSNDQSKTGKHGSMKCRMEVFGIFDKKKRIGVIPGSENLDVPIIEKRRAQILTVNGDLVSVMDLENFETIDVVKEPEIEVNEGDQVEYWKVGEGKIIKRKL